MNKSTVIQQKIKDKQPYTIVGADLSGSRTGIFRLRVTQDHADPVTYSYVAIDGDGFHGRSIYQANIGNIEEIINRMDPSDADLVVVEHPLLKVTQYSAHLTSLFQTFCYILDKRDIPILALPVPYLKVLTGKTKTDSVNNFMETFGITKRVPHDVADAAFDALYGYGLCDPIGLRRDFPKVANYILSKLQDLVRVQHNYTVNYVWAPLPEWYTEVKDNMGTAEGDGSRPDHITQVFGRKPALPSS